MPELHMPSAARKIKLGKTHYIKNNGYNPIWAKVRWQPTSRDISSPSSSLSAAASAPAGAFVFDRIGHGFKQDANTVTFESPPFQHPELTFLRVKVKNADVTSMSGFIASWTGLVSTLRPGFRTLPLHRDFLVWPDRYLFVHYELLKEDHQEDIA